MSSGELQHYIPRFLLRRFAAAESRRVHVFDKLTGASFVSNPDKLAARNSYYNFRFADLDVSLERALGDLESRAAEHVARIIKDCRLHLADGRECNELAAFFAVQMVRTPAQEVTWQESVSRMEAWLRTQGAPEEFFAFDSSLHTKENAWRAQHLKIIRQAPQRLGPYFADKDWVLLSTHRSSPFLIGDHPIAMHNGRSQARLGNLGVAVPGIELYCPLSPKLALAMYCRSSSAELATAVEARAGMPWQRAAEDPSVHTRPWGPAVVFLQALRLGGPLPSEPTNVRFFNSLQIASADRFLFSSQNDFALALEMIQHDEKYRRGLRLSEGTGKF